MHCNVCNKYRKPKKTKISLSHIKKTLRLSIVYSKCCQNIYKTNKNRFKEEESIEILKILGLINNIKNYKY